LKKLSANRDGVITNAIEFRLVESYVTLLAHEERGFRSLEGFLEEHSIWNDFLKQVKESALPWALSW